MDKILSEKDTARNGEYYGQFSFMWNNGSITDYSHHHHHHHHHHHACMISSCISAMNFFSSYVRKYFHKPAIHW